MTNEERKTNPQEIEQLVRRFETFRAEYAQEVMRTGEIPVGAGGPSLYTAGPYWFFMDRHETVEALRALRDIAEKKRWKLKWSLERVSRAFRTALVASIANPTDAQVAFKEMADFLDAPAPDQLVIMPLWGVAVTEPYIQIGPVKLFTYDGAVDERLRGIWEKVLARITNPDNEKKIAHDRIAPLFDELLGSVCAEIPAKGDDEKARLDAETALAAVSDILQILAGIYHAPLNAIVEYRVRARLTQLISIVMNPGATEVNIAANFVGPRATLLLSSDTIAKARNAGFGNAFDAVGKPEDDRNDYEATLARAIHWLADGERQANPENSLTSYITCIDMFFSSAREPITRDVAEGCAFLMQPDGSKRGPLVAALRDMYGQRSRTSHEGFRVRDETELKNLRQLTINFVARMSRLASVFKEREQLYSWIARLRTSASYDDAALLASKPGAEAL